MTDYYVAVNGNDTNDGLSESTPWQTTTKVNASVFAPGDRILFRRGDEFRGRIICSSSGELVNRIVYSSYGEGSTPLVNGALLIDNENFTLYSGELSDEIFSYTSFRSNLDDGAIRNYRIVFPSSTISGYGTGVKIVLHSGVSDWPIAGVGIGKRTTDQNVESITRITFDEGSPTVTIPGGTTKTSDVVAFEIEPGADYIITIYTTSRHIASGDAPGVTTYYNTTAIDHSQTLTQNYIYTTPDVTPGIDAILLDGGTETKIYEAELSANPRIVWEDYDRLSVRTSISSCNKFASSFYYDSANQKIYIHPRNGENAITNGRQYDAGDPSIPDVIRDNAKAYNTIEIDCCNSVGSNAVFGGVVMSGTGTIFTGKSFNSERHLISYANGSDGCVATEYEAYNSDDAAIVSYSASAPGCKNNIVTKGTLYQTPNYTGALVGTHGDTGNSSINWLISDNDFGAVYGTDDYRGWFFVHSGAGSVTLKNNKFRGPAYRTLDLIGADGVDILSNVFFVDGAADVQALIRLVGSLNVNIMHNTFVGSNLNEIVEIMTASSANTIKNNVFMVGGKIITLDADSTVNTDVDYNLYPAVTTGIFSYEGTTTDLDGWKTATGFDDHSLDADATINQETGRAGADSICINSGAWITGVNETGEADIWGNYVHRLPNIGADQGAGSPGSIQIVFEIES